MDLIDEFTEKSIVGRVDDDGDHLLGASDEAEPRRYEEGQDTLLAAPCPRRGQALSTIQGVLPVTYGGLRCSHVVRNSY